MKIVCISDTHNSHRSVAMPEGDILVHAGDFTRKGSLEDLYDFNEWLGSLPYSHKIVVAGNHDFCFQSKKNDSKKILSNAIYLEDESLEIDGVHFYGSPWQPAFFNWAFNLPRGQALADKWNRISENTDVLITHGPSYGILDRTSHGEFVGCEDLYARMKFICPKLHVFGHIHESYGRVDRNQTIFINASICNERYKPINLPVIVEI